MSALHGVTVLTFDLYGTVVDIQGGLVEIVTTFLRNKGYSGHATPDSIVTWWRRTHYQDSMIDALVGDAHTTYREIGRRAVSSTLTRAGVPFTDDEARDLVAAIERLRPFPDVIDGLHRLKKPYQLVILSNGDSDMLQHARPHIGFEFDRLISVDQAGAFKPHHATYRRAAALLGVEIGRICHVAAHPFDCIGAKAAGMQTIYVNRRGLPYGFSPHQPDFEVRDFTELVDALSAH
jgi:2-haloacid dehalogenase